MKEEEVKKKPIDAVIAELNKKHGLNTVKKEDLTVVSSGSYTIDRATGIGGYALGKLVEMYGPESSGKSTVCLHAIKAFQSAFPDRKVALFDYEHSWDKKYAISIGVDVENVLIYQPDDQEQGYDMIVSLIEKEVCSLILIDSHTAAIPKKIIEGEMGDITMGLQARNNSKFLGKIKGLIDRHKVAIIAVSQTRANIGGMGTGDISTGGNGWKFYADMRFKIWKSLDKEHESNKTTIDVIKNKCANPFGKAEFKINWGTGIDNIEEIITMAEESDVIKRAGSWYSYGDIKIGQGANGVKKTFDENAELFEEIKTKTLQWKE